MKKIFQRISSSGIIIIGLILLFPKILELVPRFERPLPILLLTFSIILILLALIFKSQRGLIFPGVFFLLVSLFLFVREEPFFPSVLNDILILPLMVAISFLSLLPFEPDKKKVITPIVVFFGMAAGIYFAEGRFINIFKQISIKPIQIMAILLILWGILRFIRS